MKRSGLLGFTLIELLTVIAIIAILAALTFAVGPRLLTMAKMRSLNATMLELRTALAQYYADNGTYPPRYGYFDPKGLARVQEGETVPPRELYFLTPYLTRLGLHNVEDYYDRFSEGYDADRDGQISVMEFSPVGVEDQTRGYQFWQDALYDGVSSNPELARMAEQGIGKRPIIYIPVNSRQFDRIKDYWLENGYFYAENWDETNPDFPRLTFPPNSYDAFVLISVGPGGDTFGVVPGPDSPGYADIVANKTARMYHILAMRAFFLATRDLNDNNALDFHYEARTTGEARIPQYTVRVNNTEITLPLPSSPPDTLPNDLPDVEAPKGYGPFIFVYQ